MITGTMTMDSHHTIYIKAFNAHAVLPRILLGFSRRRLRIQALQFFDLFENGPAELQIDFDADPAIVADLVKQLDKVVEVQSVRAEIRKRTMENPKTRNAQAAV